MSVRLRASVVGLFPESLRGFVDASILGRAQKTGLLEVEEVQLRDFADDKHRTVDDTPCGGGPGMIRRADRVLDAIDAAVAADERDHGPGRKRRVVLLDAGGPRFDQRAAQRLSEVDHLVLVCGRYEGVDARVHEAVDELVSIGDFVLTGGEVGALVILDAAVRLLPGALGNQASALEESHAGEALLEHRQYTRPIRVRGRGVPPVLLGGDHKKIAKARRKDALLRTLAVRPDLTTVDELEGADRKLLDDERVPLLDPVPVEEA